MSTAEPPSIATWMLEHWTPGSRNDALAGDLLEEFHSERTGRTRAWYWRQVLAAIAIGCFHEILDRGTALLFAVLWASIAPAWLLIVVAVEQRFNLIAHFRQMDFPWSTASDTGLLLVANLFFIWAGILLYLIPHLWFRRSLSFRLLARGVMASIPVVVAVSAALILLPKQFLHNETTVRPTLETVPTHAIARLSPDDVRQLHPWRMAVGQHGKSMMNQPADGTLNVVVRPGNAITDMHKWAVLTRLPFLLCELFTLWGITSRLRKRSAEIRA